MRLLIFIIVLLFASISATLFAMHNSGYVLIARAPWSVEMPLTLFILLLAAIIVVLYFGIHALARVWNMPREVAQWRERRQRRRADKALAEGLLHLAEANWAAAEKRLLSELRYSDSLIVNYLAAAYAAQAQGDSEKRDDYVALAQQHAGTDHSLAIGMAQAQLQYAAGQYEQALAILTQLHTTVPEHAPALRLLATVYRELRDWTGLAALLPELRRRKALATAEIEALELLAHRELLTLSLPGGSLEILERAWSTVPRQLRHHPSLIAIYAEQLIKQREMAKSEVLLRATLDNEWDETLVRLYGSVRSGNTGAQLDTAEAWLDRHPSDPVLLLTLGRLALAAEQRAKAQDYLERAANQGLSEAYAELAAVLESSDPERAREYYRRGLRAQSEQRRRTEPSWRRDAIL